jgi:hypothetical protein
MVMAARAAVLSAAAEMRPRPRAAVRWPLGARGVVCKHDLRISAALPWRADRRSYSTLLSVSSYSSRLSGERGVI